MKVGQLSLGLASLAGFVSADHVPWPPANTDPQPAGNTGPRPAAKPAPRPPTNTVPRPAVGRHQANITNTDPGPPGGHHEANITDAFPYYTIPPDTWVDLIPEFGGPTIGQPKFTVELHERQIRIGNTNKTTRTQHLFFHAGSFVGGWYESFDLYVGCAKPRRGAMRTETGARADSSPYKDLGGPQNPRDEIAWNFSYNCHEGAGHLDVRCQVPLQHIARYQGKRTGCIAEGRDRVFKCGQTLRIAAMARVTRTAGQRRLEADLKKQYFNSKPYSRTPLFNVWARGMCLDSGKDTSREDPTCNSNDDCAQYFEVKVDCKKV